jgi:DNA-binding PucR family transcriptional regulator
LLDTSGLSYDLGGVHIGVVAAGGGAEAAIVAASDAAGCELLRVECGEAIWAWFGGGEIEAGAISRRLTAERPARAPIAIGALAGGLRGWRLTHQQAKAAFEVAVRRGALVHYADVALVASAIEDDLLATSLRGIFLAPLERERDGGEVLRRTLRAYLAAGGNVSRAAAALEANRNTIASRIRTIEARTGHSVDESTAEFEVALRLEELGEPAPLVVA